MPRKSTYLVIRCGDVLHVPFGKKYLSCDRWLIVDSRTAVMIESHWRDDFGGHDSHDSP